MFDANIQYYAYNNEAGDEFGVGYLGNKEFWVRLLNTWNRNDGNNHRYVVEEWEELSPIADMRGCLLAEVEPVDQGFLVSWTDGEAENIIHITNDNQYVYENNESKNTSVPRWVSRLKTQLREA